MKQGATTPIIITIPGVSLSGAAWVIVSLRTGEKVYEFGGDSVSIDADSAATVITLTLTQEESLAIGPGQAVIDVNWMKDGVRTGCVPQAIRITDTLLKRAVEG